MFPSFAFRGSLTGIEGYDYHNRCLVSALTKLGIPLQPQSFASIIIHSQADCNLRLEYGKTHVQFTMFEADRIPKDWGACAKLVDHILVPTLSSYDAWIKSGIDPKKIGISPLGVDSDLFHPNDEPLNLVLSDGRKVKDFKTRFLNISKFSFRKNPEGLLKSWLESTDKKDDAVFIWKLNFYSPHCRMLFEEVKRKARLQAGKNIEDAAPILFLEDKTYSDEEIGRLMNTATHYFSTSFGEGWDNPMIQAAATELKLIAPNHSAYPTYLNEKIARMIPAKLIPTNVPPVSNVSIGFRGLNWWECDLQVLKKYIREAIDHKEPILESPRAYVKDRFSWENAARILIDHLSKIPIKSYTKKSTVKKNAKEKVLILTPIKNATSYLATYYRALLSLSYPRDLISIGILEGDSDDDSYKEYGTLTQRLKTKFANAEIFKKDFGYTIPKDLNRHCHPLQGSRRKYISMARNHLLFRALKDEDWVLWLDVDVVDYPKDLIEKLLSVGEDIVHPHCVLAPGGPTFDLNAWRDKGKIHLEDLRGEGDKVSLDTVGGTVLLVRADRHRDGLIFPPFPYGRENPKARPDELELDTEGLGLMAQDMGLECWGLPNLEVRHADS